MRHVVEERAAGVVGEGVLQIHGAPQAIEGEGFQVELGHNSVSMAMATLSVCFKGHSNFYAYVKEHVSHLKFPILSWTVCSCCFRWEIVALADVSIFIIDCLLICKGPQP